MAEKEVQIDLEELQDIIDSLGAPDGSEPRKHILTQADIIVIARVVKAVSHKECTRGLTTDEVEKWKFLCNAFNKGILAIGWLVIAAIVGGIIKFAWWATQHGVVEMVETTKKGVGK